MGVVEVGDRVDHSLGVADGEGVADVLEAVQRRRRDPVCEVGQYATQKLSDRHVGKLVLVEDGVVLAQLVVATSRTLVWRLIWSMILFKSTSIFTNTFQLLNSGIHHCLSAAGGAENLIVFIVAAAVVEHRLFEIVLHLARPPVGIFEL